MPIIECTSDYNVRRTKMKLRDFLEAYLKGNKLYMKDWHFERV